MNLAKILEGVTVSKLFRSLYGQMAVTQDIQVNHIQYDSRKISSGDLFVAIRGTESDGHRYIGNAISNGACVVVLEDDAVLSDSFFLHNGVMKIVVPNSRIALAQLSANIFCHPSTKLMMIGVTGTNGKTTTAHLIKSILEHDGKKIGLIGTIENKIGDEVIPATHTTPESLELNELLVRMVNNSCSVAVMEVSSHALHQHRVDGINFTGAVFTNLTQDHLDYHGTMEEYFKAKVVLFESLPPHSTVILNVDDEWARKISNHTNARIITYGTSKGADIQARDITLSMNETKFTTFYRDKAVPIKSNLIGRFNVSNILAAFSTGVAFGVQIESIRQSINTLHPIRGRFEQIASRKGWIAVIDYAHTHDALEKTLKAVHDVLDSSKRGRIITVFGCGGNRDRGKRPKMANVSTNLSDLTIVTSDNPRHEDPYAIIREIMSGVVPGKKVFSEKDRKNAIIMALDFAKNGDVILIAGKGHEDYQVVGDQKFHFSDKEIVEEYLQLHV